MRTSKFVIGLFAIVIPALAAAQVPPPPPTPATPRTPKPPRSEGWQREARGRVEETDRKTLTVGNATEIDLSNIAGDITIAPGGGRDATIEYTRRGFGDTQEEAKRQLEMIDVSMSVTGDGRAEVRSRYKAPRGERHQNFRSAVDYRVTAPAQTRIRVKTISGNVTAARMKGDLALEAVSGNIRIDSSSRVSMAKTISGDVEVSGVSFDQPLAASSVSGTVTLRNLKAQYLDISAISGDILLRDVTCERAAVQTISGNVEYVGGVAKAGRYELKSHSGDIRFAVTGGSGFDVDANSFSGTIRSDLAIKNEAEEEEEPVVASGASGRAPVRMPRRATFRGTYKDGSATIELTTFSGDIVITK